MGSQVTTFRFLLEKIFLACMLTLGALAINFFLLKMVPGSPFSEESGISRVSFEALERSHGHHLSFLSQFIRYLKSLFSGDLGYSLIFRDRTVVEILMDAFPTTLLLTTMTLLFSLFSGLVIGLSLSRVKIVNLSLLAALSLPSFAMAALLRELFIDLPLAGSSDISHFILPTLALSLPAMATVARLTSDRLKKVMREPYIEAALLRGLSKRRILFCHALPSALTPTVNYLGQLVSHLIVGSFAIEKLFALQGLGMVTTNAVLARDYPVVLASGLFYTISLIAIMLISDLIYGFIDPRLRKESSQEATLLNPF